jgi:hypothetical protein
VIGTGAPYGSIFLKQNWAPNLTMKQVAELGYFIIKYIERYSLDLSVGVNNNKPQIWFMPNDASYYSLDIEALNELEGKAETILMGYMLQAEFRSSYRTITSSLCTQVQQSDILCLWYSIAWW